MILTYLPTYLPTQENLFCMNGLQFSVLWLLPAIIKISFLFILFGQSPSIIWIRLQITVRSIILTYLPSYGATNIRLLSFFVRISLKVLTIWLVLYQLLRRFFFFFFLRWKLMILLHIYLLNADIFKLGLGSIWILLYFLYEVFIIFRFQSSVALIWMWLALDALAL